MPFKLLQKVKFNSELGFTDTGTYIIIGIHQYLTGYAVDIQCACNTSMVLNNISATTLVEV